MAPEWRDAVTVSGWPRSLWIVSAVDWSAVVLLVAGLACQAVRVARGRKRRAGPDQRKARAAIRERWLASVPSDFTDRGAVCETARYARHSGELDGSAARELADDMRAIFQTS